MSTLPATPASVTVTVPTRVFVMGSVRLSDRAPELPPLESVRLYAPNFPHLAHATLSPPEIQDGEVRYHIEKPPVTTKG